MMLPSGIELLFVPFPGVTCQRLQFSKPEMIQILDRIFSRCPNVIETLGIGHGWINELKLAGRIFSGRSDG